MPDTERDLPLFPLNVVLFPSTGIPLHVFELRYQALVADVLAVDGLFGISLIKAGQEVGGPALPYEVGTLASIQDLAELGGGRVAFNAMGIQRFHVLHLLDGKPYLRARVRLLPEDTAPVPATLVDQTREAFFAYTEAARGMTGGWLYEKCKQVDGAELSYLIATAMEATGDVQQALLETDSHLARLQQELELLQHETQLLRQNPRGPRRMPFGLN